MVACSDPPAGAARGTLRLLADTMVELGSVDSIRHGTVDELLKKRNQTLAGNVLGTWQAVWDVCRHDGGRVGRGSASRRPDTLGGLPGCDQQRTPCYPPWQPACAAGSAAAAGRRIRTARGRQSLAGHRTPAGMAHGARHGAGARRDVAEPRRLRSDEDDPATERIVLVVANVNTHGPGGLSAAFAPDEAHRLAARFAWHSTPEHGSWRTIAECERSVLAAQCLDRRIPDMTTLSREVTAWEERRNKACRKVVWHVTADARIKLRRLYPVVKEQNLT